MLAEFQNLMNNSRLTFKERNELYWSVIDFIEYKQTGAGIELQMVFK